MTGIHYLTDEEGRRVAVQIDLRENAGLWEEFEDVLVSQSRRNEERIPLEQVKAKLIRSGNLQRFQNCYTPEPLWSSGVFLKKTPPFTALEWVREFWNRSKVQNVHRLFAALEHGASLPPRIRNCARGNLLRSRALSLASRALAACERFQLPRSSLKRSKRKHALCRHVAGPA